MSTKRVGIYTRISKDKNGESVSPARQEALCRQKAEGKGWEVVKVYADPGVSGWKKGAKRPHWEALLDAVRRHEVDVIMAYSLSRLGRRTRDLLELADLLQMHGAGLVVYDMDIDTTTAAGQMVYTMMAAIGQMYSEMASESQKSAKQIATMAGKMPAGGHRQYGYTTGATATIVKAEAAIIREVSKRIQAGESVRQVAMDLNRRGVKTTRDKDWSGGTLAQMLRSPRIAGWRQTPEGRSQGAWKPILSNDEWAALCLTLDRRPKRGGGINTSRHLLTSLIKCGKCEQNMTAHFSHRPDGGSMDRYLCTKRPGSKSCGHLAVSKPSVEAHVTEEFIRFMSTVQVKPADQGEQSLADIEAGIEETEADLRRITRSHYIDKRITEADFNETHDILATKLADLQRARETASSQLAKRANVLRPGSPDDIKAWWADATMEDRRTALGKAIWRIMIQPVKVKGGNKFDTSRVQIDWSWDVYVQAYVAGTLPGMDDPVPAWEFEDEDGNVFEGTLPR
jgi:site-specific DNA recombinase